MANRFATLNVDGAENRDERRDDDEEERGEEQESVVGALKYNKRTQQQKGFPEFQKGGYQDSS